MFLCPPYLGTPHYSCITTVCFSYYLYAIIPPYYSVLLLLLLLLTFIALFLSYDVSCFSTVLIPALIISF